MGHHHYDCKTWCEACLPCPENEADFDDRGAENAPANCAGCGVLLDYSLTPEGVKYVLDYVMEALENGLDRHIIPLANTGPEAGRMKL